MSEYTAQKYLMKGIIAELEQEDQDKVAEIVKAIKELVNTNGQHGVLAISMAAIEVVEENE